MRTIWLAVLLVSLPLSAADADLSGLWRAKRWFGPEARGPLVVERNGDDLHRRPDRADRARARRER